MIKNGDPKGWIFLSHLHTNTGLFFLLTTKYLILYLKNMKDFQKILIMLVCDMVLSFKHYNDVMNRCAASVRQLVFYLFHWLVWVCEIELSHMGKNNGNLDLVCEL